MDRVHARSNKGVHGPTSREPPCKRHATATRVDFLPCKKYFLPCQLKCDCDRLRAAQLPCSPEARRNPHARALRFIADKTTGTRGLTTTMHTQEHHSLGRPPSQRRRELPKLLAGGSVEGENPKPQLNCNARVPIDSPCFSEAKHQAQTKKGRRSLTSAENRGGGRKGFGESSANVLLCL